MRDDEKGIGFCMRSMFRSVLVTLVALFAVAAVASASASAALPEFEYTTFPIAPQMTSGAVTLQTKGGHSVTCKASSASSELANHKELRNAIVTYTGCKSSEEVSCSSAGAKSGEVITQNLTATLVYINKATKEVGVLYKPASGSTVANFSCGSVKTALTGSVIAKVPHEQLNSLRTSFTWEFKQKGGVQEPTEYEEEGGTKASAFLRLFGLEQAGEEKTDTVTTKVALEIKG